MWHEKHELADWTCWSSCNLSCAVSAKRLLFLDCPIAISMLSWKGSCLSSWVSVSLFPFMCLGSKDHSFIHVSRIPVSSWNARNALQTGQSTAASSDISFDVFESEWWREWERMFVHYREIKKRSEKHMDGRTDKGMCGEECVQNRGGLHNKI